ncbi:MAG: spore cortex biosynthesis protein YabQ, partial [Oscillospiraceae bacterium]|nr:spore cortex biosynthesis protein YabQ [Oscillospiraceae bacterium]
MEVSLLGQTAEFAAALLLGAGLGFVYDCMRVIRGRLPLRAVTAALDVLFWGVCAAAAFWFAMSFGGGELRIFSLVAMMGGIVAYFCLLSVFVRAVGFTAADGVIELFRVLLHPFWVILKKIHK